MWIAAIAGVTLSARAILDALFDAPFAPPGQLWTRLAKETVIVLGWGIMAWIADRGTRRNLAPPEWLLFFLAVLIWVRMLM